MPSVVFIVAPTKSHNKRMSSAIKFYKKIFGNAT